MKKLIFIIAALLIFAGCKPKQRIVERTVTVRERITETIEQKDTTFIIQPDSAALTALVKCDSLNRAYIETISSKPGTRTRIVYTLKTDTLRIRATVDSAAIAHAWTEKTTIKEKETTDTTHTETTKRPFTIPSWLIVLVILAGLIAYGQFKNLIR